MRPSISKRIDALEKSLGPNERETVVILEWAHDSDEEREDKVARWRSGGDFPGVRSNVLDRTNADVRVIRFVSPGTRV